LISLSYAPRLDCCNRTRRCRAWRATSSSRPSRSRSSY
jgi:hypothetical protein